MKYAHLIKLTVFSYENENSQPVLDAFLTLFTFNLEDNKIAFRKKNAYGFNEKKLILTDSGKCFHLKISIAAFPKKREIALNVINNLFYEK